MPYQSLRRRMIQNYGGETYQFVQNDVTACYAHDISMQVVFDHVTGMTSDGVYIIRYDFKSVAYADAGNPGSWVEWRYTRSNGGNTRLVEYRDQWWQNWENHGLVGGNAADEAYFTPTLEVNRYLDDLVERTTVENAEDKFPGTWEVTRTLTGPVGSHSDEFVAEFDIRMLSIRNIRAEEPEIKPNSDRPTSKIKADVHALPTSWVPSVVSVNTDLRDPFRRYYIKPYSEEFAVSSSGPNGYLFSYELEWDGRIPAYPLGPDLEDPTTGKYEFEMSAGTLVWQAPWGPDFTGSFNKYTRVDVLESKCRCEKSTDGRCAFSLPLADFAPASLGPSAELTLSYSSDTSGQTPASFGWGWSSITGSRVLEPSGQNGALVYRDSSGFHLRWELENGSYVSTTVENRAEIAKTSDPDATYVVTFFDWSQQEFDSLGRLRRTLDPDGNAVTYGYSGGQMSEITDAHGFTTYLDYTGRSDGQPVRIHAVGREVLLDYDSLGRLSQITDAAGDTTELTYDSSGRIHKILDATGLVALEVEYDSIGRVSAEIFDESMRRNYYYDLIEGNRPVPPIWLDSYGINGNSVRTSLVITEEIDLGDEPAPNRYSMLVYDRLNRVRERHECITPTTFDPYVEGVWNRTEFVYASAVSPYLVSAVVDPNGNTGISHYNADQTLQSHTDRNSQQTILTYPDGMGDIPNPKHRGLVRKAERLGFGALPSISEMNYDTDGNLIEVRDALNNSVFITRNSSGQVASVTDRRGKVTSYGYTNGRLTSITEPADSAGELERVVTLSYDDFGNVVSVVDPLGNETIYVYDALNRLTQTVDAMGEVTSWTYVDGMLTEIQAPENSSSNGEPRRTRFHYDDANRLSKVEVENGLDSFVDLVRYEYDGFSQLRELQRDHGQQRHRYEYDRLGRPVAVDDFLQKVTTIEYAPFCVENVVSTPRGVERTNSFNISCQLTQVATANLAKIFEYDGLDRMVRHRIGEVYGNPPPVDPAGGRYSKGRSGFGWDTSYDVMDRPVDTPWTHTEYDVEGNVTRTDLDDTSVYYRYFDDGLLRQVEYVDTSVEPAVYRTFNYEYDLAGRLVRLEYPFEADLVAQFKWDDRGQLLSLKYFKRGSEFLMFFYEYDASGNRIAMHEVPPESGSVFWNYQYDWLDRLSYVWKDGQMIAEYNYDGRDNRTLMRRYDLGEEWTYNYNQADQLLSRSVSIAGAPETIYETYTYDDDGNMVTRTTSSGTQTYVWDDFDRLRSNQANDLQYGYDAFGIRSHTDNSTDTSCTRYRDVGGFLYDLETSASGDASQRLYLTGHQILGQRLRQPGQTSYYYYLTDGLGTVRLVIDETDPSHLPDCIVASYQADEYGNTREQTGNPDLLQHTYVGGLGVRNEIPTQGLLYMRQRWYDPTLGRFLTPDPIGFEGGLNLYAYVGNNPVNAVDPEGLYVEAVYNVRKRTLIVTDYGLGEDGKWHKAGVHTFRNLFSGDKSCANDPSKEGVPSRGPVPRGRYLISPVEDVSRTHPDLTGETGWFLLLNTSTQKSRVYVQGADGELLERDSFFIHPGRVSQGCITFPSDSAKGSSQGYPRSKEYSRLKALLQSTAPLGSERTVAPILSRPSRYPTWGGGFPGYMTVE